MRLSRTSIIEFAGFLTALFAVNATWFNPYIAAAITSILSLVAYNFFTDETGGKPVINWISGLTFAGALVGYFLDHPKETVVDGVTVVSYILPIATLSSIKNIIVIVVRYIQMSLTKK